LFFLNFNILSNLFYRLNPIILNLLFIDESTPAIPSGTPIPLKLCRYDGHKKGKGKEEGEGEGEGERE
jgi:hypothetical protein